MKLVIRSWHQSEKETKGLASVGLKHNDVLEKEGWGDTLVQIFQIYETGINVMLAHSISEPGSIIVGVSDDLFKTR